MGWFSLWLVMAVCAPGISSDKLRATPVDSLRAVAVVRPGISEGGSQLHFRCELRQTQVASTTGDSADSGAQMLGLAPPEFHFDRWARGPAQSLSDLRGHVVLVRWWTEGCDFCANTLPSIERLRLAHLDDGLEVIAIYHPVPIHHVSDRAILRAAAKLGFDGPIAVDEHWSTLNRWWLDGHSERNWTSVSFLIDRGGRVCWVQGGGEYHPSGDPRHARCDVAWRELEQRLSAALAERTTY